MVTKCMRYQNFCVSCDRSRVAVLVTQKPYEELTWCDRLPAFQVPYAGPACPSSSLQECEGADEQRREHRIFPCDWSPRAVVGPRAFAAISREHGSAASVLCTYAKRRTIGQFGHGWFVRDGLREGLPPEKPEILWFPDLSRVVAELLSDEIYPGERRGWIERLPSGTLYESWPEVVVVAKACVLESDERSAPGLCALLDAEFPADAPHVAHSLIGPASEAEGTTS